MKIVAFLGRARVGKDTASTIFSKTLGYPILRLSTPIKNACHELFGIPREHFESDEKERLVPRYGKTPRDLMVCLTHAIKQNFEADFFVNHLVSRIPGGCDGVIIPDVRYEEDIRLLRKKYGAVVIKITKKHSTVLHDHENHIDRLRADVILTNNGDLCSFENRVSELAKASVDS
jgi:hypothetical protein